MGHSYWLCPAKSTTEGAMASLQIHRNADGTITVKVGRAIEHISTDGKTKAQIFDALKYAAISKGANLDEIAITEILWRYL